MPRVGQAERFALMCPVVDVVGSVCRHAWPMTVPAGGGVLPLHPECTARQAGGRPGLRGAFQSALASFDYFFFQGKPILKTRFPPPSFVYKMTNSRIGPVLSCHVSLTCPDPVDEILSDVCPSVPSLTTSNMHILCRVYCRNYRYISIFAMRTVGTGLCWSRWGGAESSHHSPPSPRQRRRDGYSGSRARDQRQG